MRESLLNQKATQGERHTTLSISVIIISYNARDLLRDCLMSITAEPWEQVTVVDNVSSDGSGEMVRRDFPWVHLIVSSINRGYGAAANLGIAGCSSKYVLLLNPDTVLRSGTLQILGDYLDRHQQAAVAGPQLLNPDGTHQASCFEFPTPLQTLLRETSLSRFARPSSRLQAAGSSERRGQVVPWVLGAAMAIRREAFDALGGFDESFFMYFEEVDLCYRFQQAGWQTHFVPEAEVVHVGGASTKRHRAAMLRQLYRSLCHFYQQHYSSNRKTQLKMILTYLMLRNLLRDGFRSYQSRKADTTEENISVWQSILSSVWSKNGWLRG